MSKKTRLDVLLVEQGLLDSRQKAQAHIMAGLVFVNGQRVDKPGTAVANDAQIEVRGRALPYVSRGGLKLEKAMKTFPITLEGKICADIGLYSAKRRGQSLRCGRGLWSAGLEAAQRPAGGVPGAHQCPLSGP